MWLFHFSPLTATNKHSIGVALRHMMRFFMDRCTHGSVLLSSILCKVWFLLLSLSPLVATLSVNCGCNECTSLMLENMAEGKTCESHISRRMKGGESEIMACAKVAERFPLQCGPQCHPNKCDGQAPALCNCDACTPQVWNTNAGGFSCGMRYSFSVSTRTELESCARIAKFHPNECGACDPNTCSTRPPQTLSPTNTTRPTQSPLPPPTSSPLSTANVSSSGVPSSMPSSEPSAIPNRMPSDTHSPSESVFPTRNKTFIPSSVPSDLPSLIPTEMVPWTKAPSVSATNTTTSSNGQSNGPSLSVDPTQTTTGTPTIVASVSSVPTVPTNSTTKTDEPNETPSASPSINVTNFSKVAPTAAPNMTVPPSYSPSNSTMALNVTLTPTYFPTVAPTGDISSESVTLTPTDSLTSTPTNGSPPLQSTDSQAPTEAGVNTTVSSIEGRDADPPSYGKTPRATSFVWIVAIVGAFAALR